MIILKLGVKGSSTSGNYGHSGRPGKLGGSIPKSTGAVVDYSAIPDKYKDAELRAKLDNYMSEHDILPEDLLYRGTAVTIDDKPPHGYAKYFPGKTADDWRNSGNAAFDRTNTAKPRLSIPATVIDNTPEVILHEIGHIRWENKLSPALPKEKQVKNAQNWYNADKAIQKFAYVEDHEALAKIGTRVYKITEAGKTVINPRGEKITTTRHGSTPWEEAFADMFASWRVGGPAMQSNITAFWKQFDMDAEEMFGSKKG